MVVLQQFPTSSTTCCETIDISLSALQNIGNTVTVLSGLNITVFALLFIYITVTVLLEIDVTVVALRNIYITVTVLLEIDNIASHRCNDVRNWHCDSIMSIADSGRLP